MNAFTTMSYNYITFRSHFQQLNKLRKSLRFLCDSAIKQYELQDSTSHSKFSLWCIFWEKIFWGQIQTSVRVRLHNFKLWTTKQNYQIIHSILLFAILIHFPNRQKSSFLTGRQIAMSASRKTAWEKTTNIYTTPTMCPALSYRLYVFWPVSLFHPANLIKEPIF